MDRNIELSRNNLVITQYSLDNNLSVEYTENNSSSYIIDTKSVSCSASYSSGDLNIPIYILKNNSSMQAIVYYMTNNLNLKFSETAKILGRDQRTIWNSYNQAKKAVQENKLVDFGSDPISNVSIPANIFSIRNLSILETIVFHLKNEAGLSLKEISVALGKNYRTIWTINKRVLSKFEKTSGKINDK